MSEPSLHVAPLITHLAAEPRRNVAVILEADLGIDRRRLGWSGIEHGNAGVVKPTSHTERERLVGSFGPEWAHVFWGLGVYGATAKSMIDIRGHYSDAVIGVFSEPWNPQGLKGLARRLKYRSKYRRFGNVPDFVLAAGGLAEHQFVNLGFAPDQVFPFAYFVNERGLAAPVQVDRMGAQVELLFVGQLVARKRPIALLDALSTIRHMPWRLTYAGAGDESEAVMRRVGHLGLGDRVRMLGPVPSGEVPNLMAAADMLIVPSRFDGWGAVVNEALVQGTPCLVASTVGAETLVSGDRGHVFNGDVELAQWLAVAIADGPTTVDRRAAIAAWASSHISPVAGGAYLDSILDWVAGTTEARPGPPWLRP